MRGSVLDTLVKIAEEKTALDPGLTKMLLAGGTGVAVGAIPTAAIMHAHEQRARERARNVGFGAGVATGMSAPTIIRSLYQMYGGDQ